MNHNKLDFKPVHLSCRISILLIFSSVLLSCTVDAIDESAENSPSGYHVKYEDFPKGNYNSDDIVELEYDRFSKIKKRIGGFDNVSDEFTQERYEELVYNGNEISIVEKSSGIPTGNYKKVILDNQGKMIKEEGISQLPANDNFFTALYEYNGEGLLTKILFEEENTSGVIRTYTGTHYYNNQHNLDSVVFIIKTRNSNLEDLRTTQKKVAVFNNYDNSPNPFKTLFMFDEAYYRALSRNNYKRFDYFVYNYYPAEEYGLEDDVLQLTWHHEREWTFNYNDEGDWLCRE